MNTHIYSIHTGISCAYLIEGRQGLVLVDAGGPYAERAILRKIKALGRQELRLIYLTHAHFDHYAGAGALRRATGAPIAIHQADAEALAQGGTEIGSARGFGKVLGAFLPLAMHALKPEGMRADVILEDGNTLDGYGLEAVVVHTPGHTAGSSSLLVEGRFAFVGDLITAARGVHAQRYFAQDWEKVGESLKRVQDLHPQWVYGGHGCQAIPGESLSRLG